MFVEQMRQNAADVVPRDQSVHKLQPFALVFRLQHLELVRFVDEERILPVVHHL